MYENKRKIIIMGIVLGLVLLGVLVWGFMDILINKTFWSWQTVGFLVAVLIAVAFAIFVLHRIYSSVKQGYPIKDERSEKLRIHAAAWAFYIGVYWILFLMYLSEFSKLTGEEVAGGAIAGQAVIFGLAYWYLSKKGKI